MALNNIYEFGQETLNILNNADYLADPSLVDGILAGSQARSELHNKIFKQATLCGAGLSQFAADNQDENIDDSMTVEEYADALTAAIDSRVNLGITGNIITQPQFDNQPLAATDEFVNRALGSYSNSRVFNSSVTSFGITDVGKILTFLPATPSNGSATLPDYNDVRLGSVMEIQNCVPAPYVFTVSPLPGQNMLTTGGTTLANIKLGFGDTAKFAYVDLSAIGGVKAWVLVGGTISLQYSNTFKHSNATSGYYYLPGGLIMQWGVATAPNTGGDVSYAYPTLPIAFSTAGYVALCTANSVQALPDTGNVIVVTYDLTTTGFTIRTDSNYNQMNHDIPLSWIAIGK